MERINDFKARGNAALKAGNLAEAADMYTNALAVYGASQSFVDASVVSIVYANRSMTRLRQDRPEEALEDANGASVALQWRITTLAPLALDDGKEEVEHPHARVR